MFGNLSPKQKKILAALGAAGALALVVMIGRRGSSTAAPDAGDLGAVSVPPVSADNGASAGQESSDLTSAFGALQTEIDSNTSAIGDLNTSVSNIPVPTPGLSADDVTGIVTPIIGSALASWSGTPSGASSSAKTAATASHPAAAAAPKPTSAQTKAAAKPNVAFQDSGSRAGLNFQTVVKDSKVYRFYESKPGKADYGSGGKVYVRPASSK